MHTTNLAAKLIKIFELYKYICKILQTILFLTQNQEKKNQDSKPDPDDLVRKITDKVTGKVTERRHLEMQFCNDAIDERAIRLPLYPTQAGGERFE
jgi:hypothetical protein